MFDIMSMEALNEDFSSVQETSKVAMKSREEIPGDKIKRAFYLIRGRKLYVLRVKTEKNK